MTCLDVPVNTGTPLLNTKNNILIKMEYLELIISRAMTATIGGAERRIRPLFMVLQAFDFLLFKMVK